MAHLRIELPTRSVDLCCLVDVKLRRFWSKLIPGFRCKDAGYKKMNVKTIFVYTLLKVLVENTILCDNVCKNPLESKKIVNSCPQNETVWGTRSKNFNCEKYRSNGCSNIYYHCVINEFGNKTIEVCAHNKTIIGHCTEFNEEAGIIQPNLVLGCKEFETTPCNETHYNSIEAYRYEECYNYTKNAEKFEKIEKAERIQNNSVASQASYKPKQSKQRCFDDCISDSHRSLVVIILCNVFIMIIIVIATVFLYCKLRPHVSPGTKKKHGGDGDESTHPLKH